MDKEIIKPELFPFDNSTSEEDKALFLNSLEKCDFKAENQVVAFGANDDDGMYIITKGTAIVKNAEGAVINELHEGDHFGELALLTEGGRTATVEAEGELETVRIPKSTYKEVIAKNPKNQAYLFGNLYKNLSSRYNKIIDLTRQRQKYFQMFLVMFFYLTLSVVFSCVFGVLKTNDMFSGELNILIDALVRIVLFIATVLIGRITLKDFGIYKNLQSFVISLVLGLVFSGVMILTYNAPVIFGGITNASAGWAILTSWEMGVREIAVVCCTILFSFFISYVMSMILPKKGNALMSSIFSALIGIVPIFVLFVTSVTPGMNDFWYRMVSIIVMLFAVNFAYAMARLKLKNTLGLCIGALLPPLVITIVFAII